MEIANTESKTNADLNALSSSVQSEISGAKPEDVNGILEKFMVDAEKIYGAKDEAKSNENENVNVSNSNSNSNGNITIAVNIENTNVNENVNTNSNKNENSNGNGNGNDPKIAYGDPSDDDTSDGGDSDGDSSSNKNKTKSKSTKVVKRRKKGKRKKGKRKKRFVYTKAINQVIGRVLQYTLDHGGIRNAALADGKTKRLWTAMYTTVIFITKADPNELTLDSFINKVRTTVCLDGKDKHGDYHAKWAAIWAEMDVVIGEAVANSSLVLFLDYNMSVVFHFVSVLVTCDIFFVFGIILCVCAFFLDSKYSCCVSSCNVQCVCSFWTQIIVTSFVCELNFGLFAVLFALVALIDSKSLEKYVIEEKKQVKTRTRKKSIREMELEFRMKQLQMLDKLSSKIDHISQLQAQAMNINSFNTINNGSQSDKGGDVIMQATVAPGQNQET